MTAIEHLELAMKTLEDTLMFVQNAHIRCHLARAYADLALALEKLKKDGAP